MLRYFSSPEAAVPAITELLRLEDFETLASYYDLSQSSIPRSHLESGAFFVSEEPPEVAHPAGFWRYLHPFPPGFEYCSMRASGTAGVYVIGVEISIDEGAESPPQVGRAFFKMMQHPRGWQLLPDPVDGDAGPEVPRSEPGGAT